MRRSAALFMSLALSAFAPTASSALQADAVRASEQRVHAASLGGRIAAARLWRDAIVMAVGHTVRVRQRAEVGREVRYTLPDAVRPRLMAVGDHHAAVVLANGDVFTVDLDRERDAAVERIAGVPNGSITSLHVSGSTLAVALDDGLIALHRLGMPGGSQPLGVVHTERVVDGAWLALALSGTADQIVAVLQARTTGWDGPYALIAITVPPSGEPSGALVAELDAISQPRDLDVDARTAYVLTQSKLVAVDLQTGEVSELPVDMSDSTTVLAETALAGDALYLYAKRETFTAINANDLVAFDVSDPSAPRRLEALAVQPWAEGLRLDAAEGTVLLTGSDDASWHATSGGRVAQVPEGRAVAVEVIDAVALEGGDVIASRPRGLCALDRRLDAVRWCAEMGRGLARLYRDGPWLVGHDSEGVVAMLHDGERTRVVDALEPDDPTHRYRDLVPHDEGYLALVDVNPPRSARTRYRLEQLTLTEDGALRVDREQMLMVAVCGVDYMADMAVASDRLAIGCGEQVVAFDFVNGSAEPRGALDVGSRVASLDIAPEGYLVVGAEDGLAIYDAAWGRRMLVESAPRPEHARTYAANWIEGCVVAVQGVTLAAHRFVNRYCPDPDGGAWRGTEIHRYWRPEGSSGAVRVTGVPGGTMIVTGYGQAVVLEADDRRPLVYLPALSN